MDKPPKAHGLRKFLFTIARRFAGPLLGALVGIIGGIAGILIGALLGILLQQLISQRRADKKVARYFEEPGKIDFNEGAPGLSAYCALGTILVSLSVRAAKPNPLFQRKSAEESDGQSGQVPPTGLGKDQGGELIARRVIHSAMEAFPGSSPALSLMEAFCRIALSMTDRLNPDLLAESLAARRSGAGDLKRLGRELESLAQGDRALREAASIRLILDPLYTPGEDEGRNKAYADSDTAGSGADDPWLVMGLKKGATVAEIKSRFRKLAALYHPDVLQSLDEAHQQTGAKTFILIQEAYRKLRS